MLGQVRACQHSVGLGLGFLAHFPRGQDDLPHQAAQRTGEKIREGLQQGLGGCGDGVSADGVLEIGLGDGPLDGVGLDGGPEDGCQEDGVGGEAGDGSVLLEAVESGQVDSGEVAEFKSVCFSVAPVVPAAECSP